MRCFCGGHRKNSSASDIVSTEVTASTMAERDVKKPKEEVLLRIPGCAVHLLDEEETIELAKGDFTLVRLSDDNVFLANIVKVSEDIQWPLTKDEPVLKLDAVHYLFSLPMKEGGLMSYGVSFSGPFRRDDMSLVDSFLKEHSCFSDVGSSSASSKEKPLVEWKSYAPRIEEYNGLLAKAIAAGTGQIVKGIFKCTDAYTKQVQKGGEMIMTGANEQKKYTSTTGNNRNENVAGTKKSDINKALKRVRKLSKMTEKMSKSVLSGIEVATGSIVTPVFQSKAGKAILSTVPGEALLASLEAINKVLDAAEVAEKRAFSATSNAASRAVSKRFGENAGEATEDILATAGHCAGTAWNIFKIRKALTPKSSVSSAVVRNAATTKI